MSKTVAAVMLRVPRSVYGMDIGNRADEFVTMVSQGVSYATRKVPNADMCVFVAPEYFFSKFDAYGTKVDGTKGEFAPVSRSDKHDIYADIVAASKAYPRVLIVGGSIFYTRTKGIIFKQKQGLNVCPIAIGGKVKYKIYKENDDHALREYDADAAYTVKNKSNPVFTENGITFAFDVCRDHNSGRARNFAQDKGLNFDVHILISAGAAPSQVAGKNVLHCDLTGSGVLGVAVAKTSDTGTFGKTNPGLTPVGTKSAPQVHGVEYVVYSLAV